MRRRELMGLAAAGVVCGQAEGERRRWLQATMKALTAERKGRTWAGWSGELAGLRKELRAVMEAAEGRSAAGEPARKTHLLRAAGTPPLFDEMYVGGYIAPVAPDPIAWAEGLLSPDTVRATSRWLQKQGIDLLFVPVPKMPEIYMDRIVPRGMPADQIVSPHLRKLLFELLADDVEVVDLLPALLQARNNAKEPLYLPADSHWAPAGRAVCVRMLAERIGRYGWARAAKRAAPLYTAVPSKLLFPMSYLALLTAEEKAAVEAYLTPTYDRIFLASGKPYGNFESAPVMIIGDSYSELPGPQLAHALNVPVAMMPVPGGTVQPVKELMRNRLALGESKVVVWIVNSAIFCLHDWTGFPEVVQKEWTGRK